MDSAATREKLEIRLDELRTRAGHIGADLTTPHSADSEDAAVEAESDVALIGQSALIELEIAQVRAALDRLADGSYGICITCEGDIAPARLEAMPEAAQCIACASGGGKA